MMPRRQALDSLVDLARQECSSAARQLASEQSSGLELQTQLDMLGRYRLEYSQRLQQVMSSGIALTTLRDHHLFLASLDEALQRGHHSLAEQQQRLQQCRQYWQQEQQRLSSYTTLVKRVLVAQQQCEQRQELRQSDENSTNTYARNCLAQATAQRDSNEESA